MSNGCAGRSCKQQTSVVFLAAAGGRSVLMLVHHSRNSEQKQWEETLVLALVGATKVLRSHLAVLSSLDVWSQAWAELMQVWAGWGRGAAPPACLL